MELISEDALQEIEKAVKEAKQPRFQLKKLNPCDYAEDIEAFVSGLVSLLPAWAKLLAGPIINRAVKSYFHNHCPKSKH